MRPTMGIVKGFLAAVAIALLALIAHPGAGATPERAGESRLAAAPLPQSAIASQPCIPLRPVLPDIVAPTADPGVGVAPEVGNPAAAGGRSLLISAQLWEKYRSFRESLTSP